MRNILLPVVALLSSCGGESSHAPSAPSHAELIAHESELLKLTLTSQAQQRLGIQTMIVGEGAASAVRPVAGEIVVPPSVAGGVPTSSTTNLQQIGAQQAVADGDVARAEAQLRLARIAFARAEALVREEAGSVRARDEAAGAAATAEATLRAARTQRRLLGPAVASLSNQTTVWVRASTFSGDLDEIDRAGAAVVRVLGDGKLQRVAKPIQAVPSANASAGTIDLYYALSNSDRAFRVGQRVAVDLPTRGQIRGLSVPSHAIVRDIYGGEWVYRRTGQDSFVRQRVEVSSETGGLALLSRGLAHGHEVVTAGAAELFGTEFGAAH